MNYENATDKQIAEWYANATTTYARAMGGNKRDQLRAAIDAIEAECDRRNMPYPERYSGKFNGNYC